MLNRDLSSGPLRASSAPSRPALACVNSNAPAPPAPGSSGLALADLNLLLSAVGGRLRRLAQQSPCQGALLECAEALAQLHDGLAQELRRRRQLELALFDTQVYLAQARAELMGTREGEQRARHLALHDALTDLPNRRSFGERLADAMRASSTELPAVAVLCLELGEFARVNEQHGCQVGDMVLKIVAERLRRAVRSTDMVSRIGSDEFACLRAATADPLPLSQLATKLCKVVAEPIKVGTLSLRLRPCIGIARFPGDGASADSLLMNAAAAMRQARRAQLEHGFCSAQAG